MRSLKKYEDKFFEHGLEVELRYKRDPNDGIMRVWPYPYPMLIDRAALEDEIAIKWISEKAKKHGRVMGMEGDSDKWEIS